MSIVSESSKLLPVPRSVQAEAQLGRLEAQLAEQRAAGIELVAVHAATLGQVEALQAEQATIEAERSYAQGRSEELAFLLAEAANQRDEALAHAERSAEELTRRLIDAQGERDAAQLALMQARFEAKEREAEVHLLRLERDQLVDECGRWHTLAAEKAEGLQGLANLQAERDFLLAQRDELAAQKAKIACHRDELIERLSHRRPTPAGPLAEALAMFTGHPAIPAGARLILEFPR